MLDGEAVPATHKILSLFESHAGLLCKRNQVMYGHKVCLSFGHRGVVLQTEILRGNPSDSTLAVPTLEQVQANTGKTPSQIAMDAGFACKKNLADLKAAGVQQVGFNQGWGASVEQICGSRAVHSKLRRFRAGVEGLISWLKRSLSMGQSRWKGQQSYWSYVYGVVVTASLIALALNSQAQQRKQPYRKSTAEGGGGSLGENRSEASRARTEKRTRPASSVCAQHQLGAAGPVCQPQQRLPG